MGVNPAERGIPFYGSSRLFQLGVRSKKHAAAGETKSTRSPAFTSLANNVYS